MSSLLRTILGTTSGKGGVLGTALTVGAYCVKKILKRRGVSVNLKYLIESLLSKKPEQMVMPDDAIRQAQAIEEILQGQHLLPGRIAIDGLPGSGKSTLAQALAERLGMETICLDHQNMDKRLRFAKVPAIYEHHRLLRTQNIDRFEVIIYIDQPVTTAKHQILQRERGAYLLDIMNFELMQRIGAKAFALADGPVIAIDNSFARIKIRPLRGFKVMENLARELRAGGVDDARKAALNKEQQLFLLTEGRSQKGFMAYVNARAYKQDFFSALFSGLARITTRRKARR